MARKGWARKIVGPYVQDAAGFCHIVDPMDAEKMVARQHAAAVRTIKRERTLWLESELLDDFMAAILAALATRKGGG